MDFKVLGPLLVADGSTTIEVGGPRQRRLLGALIASANRVVATDTLIEIVFEGEPPDGAPTTIRSYVARLRKTLDQGTGAEIVTEPPGYALRLDPNDVDATRFASAAELGRRQIDEQVAVDAADTLRSALAMWRGPAYGEFAFEDWARGESARLDELRIDAHEHLIEAQLACGLVDDVIPELVGLIEEYPLRERLRAQCMLALHRSGRHAEALRTFDTYRFELIEVGLEPTADLIALERSIAAHDPALQLTAPAGRALRGYRLGARLGVGRQGEVFRAVQPVIGREVAIKIIRSDLADEPAFIRRFDHEAQAVSRLEHPHIVPLHDYWREPCAAYMVMRLLPSNLADRLGSGPLSVAEATEMVHQLGSALASAHRAGLVHGDIRPSNVLIDEDGNYFLSDFALAGLEDAVPVDVSVDRSGHIAPELRAGGRPGRATDQFGLAVLTALALTGTLPFGRAGARSERDHFPSLHAQRPSVPDDVDPVMMRATACRPEDRYADVADFVDELVGSLGGTRRRDRVDRAPVNPFRGLEPFVESDADWFFGRDDVIDTVVARLGDDDERSRFVTVIGASGSGKSSLVRAGVVPRVRAGALPGSDEWFVVTMVPGSHPFADLDHALRSIATQGAGELVDRSRPHSVSDMLHAAVGQEQPVLLVIDQLEELFTLSTAEERDAFVVGLTDAIVDDRSRLRVVATLRADYHDRPLHHSRFGRLVADGAVTIAGMNAGELDQAIRRPAARSGIEIDPAVISEIIAALVDQPAALPLLQFTLTELFQRRSGRMLTLEAYRSLGGVDGAVARRADDVYDELGPADRDRVRLLFLRLLAVDDIGSATRRRVLRSELTSLADDGPAIERIIDAYGRARLLSFDRDGATREPQVEIAHEALITQWPRLRAWVVEADEGLRIRSQLTTSTQHWLQTGRDSGDLYRGGRLDAAVTWAADPAGSLTTDEQEFLDASIRLREADEAARREYLELQARSYRRLRAMVGVVGLALVLALIMGFVAIGQRNDARHQSRVAGTRELLAASSAALATDPELSALLAIEAVERSDPALRFEAADALHHAVLDNRLIASVPSGLSGLASFSPDGASFVTAGLDPETSAAVWTIDPLEQRLTLAGHGSGVTSANYSPDGRQIITTSIGEFKVWDAVTGDLENTVEGPAALQSAFNSDGSMAAITGFGGVAGLWEQSTGDVALLASPFVTSGVTLGAAFSPDDTVLAIADTAPEGSQASLWDVATKRITGELDDHSSDVTDVDFSPDGSRLYTSSKDGTVKVWDADTLDELGTFSGHESEVRSLAISGDGTVIATAGANGLVLLWDPLTFEVRSRLRGHVGTVDSVQFSPDDSMLLTGSFEDRTTRIWDVRPNWRRELLSLPSRAITTATPAARGALAFAPDGRSLTVARGDALTTWEFPSGRELATLTGFGTSARSITIDPRGELVGVAGDDGATVHTITGGDVVAHPLVDTAASQLDFHPDGRQLVAAGPGVVLIDPETDVRASVASAFSWVFAVALSPDGERLAISRSRLQSTSAAGAGFEGAVELIDLDDSAVIARIDAGIEEPDSTGGAVHTRQVLDLAFSHDGTRLATASQDGSTAIWDSSNLQLQIALADLGGEVTTVTFDPVRDHVATGGSDGTVRVWDIDTGAVLLTLEGGRAVADVAYSPDGRYLAATDPDGATIVFILDVDELVAHARQRLTRALTDAECRQYLHTDGCTTT